MRIGIDVGGTNTDAVLMDDMTVRGGCTSHTTPDVSSGITAVPRDLLDRMQAWVGGITGKAA